MRLRGSEIKTPRWGNTSRAEVADFFITWDFNEKYKLKIKKSSRLGGLGGAS
jgi:hypothetical protein